MRNTETLESDLAGKTVLITGAAKGIGRATAAAFADLGAAVVALDIADLEGTANQLTERSANHLELRVDVTRESEVSAAVDRAVEQFGQIDVLVNNAGILLEKPLCETSEADFRRVVDVNLWGVFLVGREVISHMTKMNVAGRVINLSSELGLLGREKFSVYCATKGAVISLTRSWAREFAPRILVNAVAPGPVDTDMIGLETLSPEWVERELDTPLGRVGKPEEIAHMIVFLAGSGSTFTTGQVYNVNGGVAMY